ncbi:ABC transporter permease [Pelolinea submarina]|uniref:Nucleoside ABC transporter membrane protein n=1 Tax=Pelolinea submarina TaxID=913107 RepID=A0A347ZQS1_9CHLR|nr:ABC transporter permease [Pelolinea submarina]REG11792.1 nucleoside ABC transporter membrane protein [Pelolinea submarina]BBB47652.1 simple sugar transport system permease protein [Pelolinea submarina]
MKKLISKILNNDAFGNTLASLISIFLGLIVGLVVMVIFNRAGAWPGFLVMLQGGFSDGARGIGQVLYYTTPLILVGLAVGFSFQTGLFNIGVIGQFTIAAYVAIIIGGKLSMPASIHWIVALIGASLAGVIWAAVPGLLKAYFRVSEIISCIMMNYIALYLVNQLVHDTHYESTTAMSAYVKKTALMPKMGLDTIFPGSTVNSGLFIAIIMAILVYILLYKTSFGYSLRCCGLNRDASKYAGINETRNIIIVMLISGFIAGLAGGILYLSAITKNYKISELFINEPGYSIPVALLGMSHPIGIIFSSLFIAYIIVGGSLMQGYGFPVETVGIITAVLIYFSAFSLIFKNKVNKFALQFSYKESQKTDSFKNE